MPVPARRHSKTRTRSRRAHHALKRVAILLCEHCQAPLLPHTACKACGFYKGRQVLNVSRAKTREATRLQKKAFEKARAAETPEEKEETREEAPHDHAKEISKERKAEDASKVKKESSKVRRFLQRKKPE